MDDQQIEINLPTPYPNEEGPLDPIRDSAPTIGVQGYLDGSLHFVNIYQSNKSGIDLIFWPLVVMILIFAAERIRTRIKRGWN